MTTPRQQGFRMPAEFTPHLRTWMMWPCRGEVWPDIAATRRAYARVAHAIRPFEPVTMLCRPEDAAEARALLGSDINLIEIPLDDSWARDAGANFLLNPAGDKAAALFRFNAWGGKYAPFDADAEVGAYMAGNLPTFRSKIFAEGGGVSVDGAGTILTTESCFPNPNRNPGLSRDEIERELCDMLGGDKVIWLPGNPLEVETDGHVDAIAIFTGPGQVLAEAPSSADQDWELWELRNLYALKGQTDARGRAISVTTLPAADESCHIGPRFCPSYVNSYFVNGAVITPAFGVSGDAVSREIWQDAAPGREIVQIEINDIAVGGGGIHCITQQEPAGDPP